jgi:O-antigen biosynthesis protein
MSTSSKESLVRPRVEGKFITIGGEKFYIKGVTYGTFAPDAQEQQFPSPAVVERDFLLMQAQGVNAVRTYTVPPLYLLDAAARYGLRVMVGLPWEQHITFLDDPDRVSDIIRRVQQGVRSCQAHPAVLCYTIGNEIPAPIVRWYGARRIEGFLHRLYQAVKAVDPVGLVTYVNYPTTEYLSLPFLDFICFNVYLETREKLKAYLSRLHNLAGDLPLVMAEIGLDSQRNGTGRQAQVLDWQIRTIFARGCAGLFVFAWTDEWWRGGHEIEDWDFGLVDRQRQAKPALSSVAAAFADAPFGTQLPLPHISVVVCTYNGAATLRDCLEGLLRLDYPYFEVIVVDDGSTDGTAGLVAGYPFRLISTENRGLSSARNTGLYAATGEIVAYIDDDAYPDPHWLRYLAYSYLTTSHAGMGGPNLLPASDGPIATCVFHAPGGPVHVLTTDEVAEHIPGCNMSFRREVLLEIGGFDEVYRTAGDDVDVCWRVQHTGRTIGFHPSAVVWHHRRNSLKAYWKQQKGYGRAEALLEQKWPQKYNSLGHVSWGGRIYGNGVTRPLEVRRNRIFYGIWGSAPFQSVYQPATSQLAFFPLMPEWYLLTGTLGVLSVLGAQWPALLWALPVFVVCLLAVVVQAGVSAAGVKVAGAGAGRWLKYWLLTAGLHFVQPVARLWGRFAHGLTPWRRRGPVSYRWSQLLRRGSTLTRWSEQWRSAEEWLTDMEAALRSQEVRVRNGGEYDGWDLQVSGSLVSVVRGLLTIEEHGAGKQLLRLRCRTRYSAGSVALMIGLITGATMAAFSESYLTSTLLGSAGALLMVNISCASARAMSALERAFNGVSAPVEEAPVMETKPAEPQPKLVEMEMVYSISQKLDQDFRQFGTPFRKQ